MQQPTDDSQALRQELLTLLETLVSFDTVNVPHKNIKITDDCPKFIVKYLTKKGIEAKLFEDDGYYSVYGKVGSGKFHLLLMAHFDVVPVGDGWDTEPFKLTVKDSLVYGRGVIDNKNNIASFMAILPKIKELALENDMTVCFDFSGDEEIGGVHGSGNYLKKFERMPDAVINGDSAGNVVISRRRNAMGATIKIPKRKATVKGVVKERQFLTEQYGRHSAYQNHGSDVHCMIRASVEASYNDWKVASCEGRFIKGNVIPDSCTLQYIIPSKDGKNEEFDEGLTTLFENLRFLVRTQFPTEFSTYGITIGPNMLFDRKDSWELKLDIRAMTQEYEQVEQALREMCDELFGKEGYSLSFKAGQGRVNTSRDSSLIQTALEVSREFGFPAKVVEMGGASDARYFSREGVPTFDFGPVGGGVHARNEWLNIPSFVETTNFYFAMVQRLLQKTKKGEL